MAVVNKEWRLCEKLYLNEAVKDTIRHYPDRKCYQSIWPKEKEGTFVHPMQSEDAGKPYGTNVMFTVDY